MLTTQPVPIDPGMTKQLLDVGGPAVAVILALGVVCFVLGKWIILPGLDKRSKSNEVLLESTLECGKAAHAAKDAATASQAAAQNALSAAEMSHQTVMKVIERLNAS